MGHRMIYITTPTADEALAIGRALVERRLAACANVLDGVRSVYWWDGEVQSGDEAVLIVKTPSELAEAAMAEARRLHSYDCPAIVCLPIAGGSDDYLAWIDAETINAPKNAPTTGARA